MEMALGAVNNEVRGLKAALIEGFDQMKVAVVKMENRKEENTRNISSDKDKEKENTVVFGGLETDSVVPPYTVKTLSRMPEQRQGHSVEIFDDDMLIVGGSTTNRYRDNVKSVILYDVKNNKCKQLAPLPYEMSDMANVKWSEDIVVIGGADKHGKALDTVVIYNVKTEQSHMLPPMGCKRRGCAAVVRYWKQHCSTGIKRWAKSTEVG